MPGGYKRVVAAVAHSLTDFVFPRLCLFCAEYLNQGIASVCQSCWMSLPEFGRCEEGDLYAGKSFEVSPVFALWDYEKRVEKIIHEIKFRRKKRLAGRTGMAIGHAIAKWADFRSGELIVPIPLSSTRYRERGYNQSGLLADGISSVTEVPVERRVLSRTRNTLAQSGLKAQARLENVKDAFVIDNAGFVRNRHVILVDDVITTGATIGACAALMHQSGASQISAATAAISLLQQP